MHYLNWLMPLPNETLPSYAGRMSEKITEDNATLIGVSFGGMLSLEIAKIRALPKVVLISSVKTHHEIPRWMKTLGMLKADAIMPRSQLHSLRPMKIFEPVENYFLGAESEEEKRLAHEYRRHADPVYLKWSIHQVLNWKNDWLPEKLFHIHGTNDKIFPYSLVHPTHTITAAGHFLVYQRAGQVSAILNDII